MYSPAYPPENKYAGHGVHFSHCAATACQNLFRRQDFGNTESYGAGKKLHGTQLAEINPASHVVRENRFFKCAKASS